MNSFAYYRCCKFRRSAIKEATLVAGNDHDFGNKNKNGQQQELTALKLFSFNTSRDFC